MSFRANQDAWNTISAGAVLGSPGNLQLFARATAAGPWAGRISHFYTYSVAHSLDDLGDVALWLANEVS